MTEDDRRRFCEALRRLSDAYRVPLTKGAIAAHWRWLESFLVEDVEGALATFTAPPGEAMPNGSQITSRVRNRAAARAVDEARRAATDQAIESWLGEGASGDAPRRR